MDSATSETPTASETRTPLGASADNGLKIVVVGGFGAGKAPFWERPAFVVWTGAADDPDAEAARLAEDDAFKGW